MTTTLTFSRTGVRRRYTITQEGAVVGNLEQPATSSTATAQYANHKTTITRPSWTSSRLEVASAGLRAVYAPAPLSGSIVRRAVQLFEREGMITLNSRTYRFAASGLGTYAWTLQEPGEAVVISYTFKLLNEQGTITVEPLPGDDEKVLVPLGLHVALKRRRDNSSNAGFVATIG